MRRSSLALALILFPCIGFAQTNTQRLQTDYTAINDARLAVICGLHSQEWGDTVLQAVGIDLAQASQVNVANGATNPPFPKMPYPTESNCEKLQNDPFMIGLENYVIQANNN